MKKKTYNSLTLAIEIFGIKLFLIELWMRPWIQSINIGGIESGNFMFHVFYIEREPDRRITGCTDVIWRIEIFGIKNFKWDSDND